MGFIVDLADVEVVVHYTVPGEEGERVLLTRIDTHQLDNAYPGWQVQTSDTPFGVIEEPRRPLSARVVLEPTGSGSLNLITVEKPAEVEGCDALPFPAAFIPFIKWGVISDMLSKESEANDPQRAEYGENRFEEGIELAKLLLGTQR